MNKTEFVNELLNIINDLHTTNKVKKVAIERINQLLSQFFVESNSSGVIEHNVVARHGMDRSRGVTQMTKTESQLADESKGIFVH